MFGTQDSSDRDRFLRFVWVGKFGKYFFHFSREVFGILNNLKIHGSALAA